MKASTASALVGQLSEHFSSAPRAIVVFSASWPIARAIGQRPDVVAEDFCRAFIGAFPQSTLLMPTFTSGFDAVGVCNLDTQPSATGLISETFRRLPGVRRSRSAFFSFAVSGPELSDVVALAPEEAWGRGSLYHWLRDVDAKIVTVGTHPTHCSVSHLAEWLMRDRISYRFNKTFAGELWHEGTKMPWEETLFVRQRDPEPINDFTWLLPNYLEAGMRLETQGGITLSSISTTAKMAVLTTAIERDAAALVRF